MGSAEFWCVLVGFLWVLVSSGRFLWVLLSSGEVLVCSGVFWWGSCGFWWVLVGSGGFWCVLVQFRCVLVRFLWVLVSSGGFWWGPLFPEFLFALPLSFWKSCVGSTCKVTPVE